MYVSAMRVGLFDQWKGDTTSDLDNTQIQAEVDQILQSVDFDQNGYIEYSGKKSSQGLVRVSFRDEEIVTWHQRVNKGVSA